MGWDAMWWDKIRWVGWDRKKLGWVGMGWDGIGEGWVEVGRGASRWG